MRHNHADMSTHSDFRLYQSNALDLLAELLAEALRQPVEGRPLLEPDTILIPQVAMRRWLQATLAKKYGVAANLKFLTPGEFVTQALEANLGKSADDLAVEGLHWRLYEALGDTALLAQPALAAMAHYLEGGDPVRRWALAGELANIFNKYSAWRRDWLLRWDGGADPEDPQAILWRAVSAGTSHRAKRIGDYLARYAKGDALPQGLPKRLFVFATLNISPDVLRVLATQARVGTLHFYLPSPARSYWGDLQTRRADAEEENPLLRDWGAAGKDFMALLGGYEVVHPSGEIESFADPAETQDGFAGSLLRQLQSDLFHRRPSPTQHRAEVDKTDPSLQFHACHTRLRELQVLHDRLRAMLDPQSEEGRRFDPPLQPREIAVLAPDIDQYAPYLDAVFGGSEGEMRIPYALADASPLHDEPLAAVFLRLLALPVARFGLNEILDLLASPALAEAAGLEEADFTRLHTWLHAAGARWGLDAAHRARSGAPADAAFTWQFALDRLLLGMASGSEEALEMGSGTVVAPWPQLEGSALNALDRLLSLLRELARHEQLLRETLTPVRWRERLLGLLDALLPQSPSNAAAQRALERLRTLIDDFAQQAAQAGVAVSLPIDVIRTHFSSVLGEADTRAPLLTGGVSFARMVPMRLLPFRVICLLGMNDGEFPRRDPAAGLNRLTAELGTTQRRIGDRSTRDDDRFLFLQLLSSAHDVFYLSWLGAHPRDGSVREPSALVSELLASVDTYHQCSVAQDMVLTHPLQPFSKTMFGDGQDPRRFSYRAAWQAAARQQAEARQRLAPWMPLHTTLPTQPPTEEPTLTLDTLQRFFKSPSEAFLRQRLGLRLSDINAEGEDIELLAGMGSGLDHHDLQKHVLNALVAGEDQHQLLRQLRARAMLPSGPVGLRALEQEIDKVTPYAKAFATWCGAAQADTLALELEIDGLQLRGVLKEVYPQGIARLRCGEPNGPSVLRNGLDWLLASAAECALPFFEFHDDKEHGAGPHPRPYVKKAQAIEALRALLALRKEGLQQPLPFAPYSGWLLYHQRDDIKKGLSAAAKKWRGNEWSFAEGKNEALQLALRGLDIFSDVAITSEFARVSGVIFGAVKDAKPAAIDIDASSLPEREDTEDAA